MIFVTVGTELPFDRLVRVVDDWARAHNRRDVFAQIGRTDWRPSFIPCAEFLEPPEFNAQFAGASVIVGHAGMGTILSALRYGKPILVMPRRAALGEQRNDHQLATAKRLLELDKIHVALDEQDLRDRLSNLEQLHVRGSTGEFAGNSLLTALSDLIHHGATVRPASARLQPASAPGPQASPLGHLGLSG
jgi:UDP-N-acetylglucosamine transferase subunit ALG13